MAVLSAQFESTLVHYRSKTPFESIPFDWNEEMITVCAPSCVVVWTDTAALEDTETTEWIFPFFSTNCLTTIWT